MIDKALKQAILDHWWMQRWNRHVEPKMRHPEMERVLCEAVENLKRKVLA